MFQPTKFSHKQGSIGWIFLIFFLILLMFLLAFDDFTIAKFVCEDAESRVGCILGELLGADEEEKPEEGTVVATGVISRVVKGSERSATVTMNIPLAGGKLSGSVSGDCDGALKGTYADGKLSGTAQGICGYIFPVNGTFTGSVNKTSKTVSITAKGEAVGKTGEGSMSLSYKQE